MRRDKGFTLVEIMVVVVIIAVLATIFVTQVVGAQKKAFTAMTESAIGSAQNNIDRYYLDCSTYPDKLEDLVTKPSSVDDKQWAGPYVKSVPIDAWKRALVYRKPGTGGEAYDIGSYGADGKPGGTNQDADIWSYDMKKTK